MVQSVYSNGCNHSNPPSPPKKHEFRRNQLSNGNKTPMTFHYTDWFIGIRDPNKMACYNPYITGWFGIPWIANSQVLVTAQLKKSPPKVVGNFVRPLPFQFLRYCRNPAPTGMYSYRNLDNLIIYIVASRPSWCSCWHDDPPSKTAGNLHSSTLQAGGPVLLTSNYTKITTV